MLAAVLICCFASVYGQTQPSTNTTLHNGLTEKIGNFSVEILYHTAKVQQENLIMSPITLWTVLAVIAEGATEDTLKQINNAIRTTNRQYTRRELGNILQWLLVNTTTVQLEKVNTIFVDGNSLIERDFQDLSKHYYLTDTVSLNFSNSEKVAEAVNVVVSNLTRGKIPKLVDSQSFGDAVMILTSALYFSGQWTVPFNASSTAKMPFFNSNGTKIGDVNMMYNRYTYPFANIRDLQARVIELPYGNQDRLSMLVMMPDPGVSLENMFLNFNKVTLDNVFKELRISREEYGEDEVDCLLPRFKIKSDLVMTDILRDKMGIVDLFDEGLARLGKMARMPIYASKVIHKAEIEVTEEGTTAAAATAVEFSNRIGVIRFEANRPFTYLIIEKITNSIVFGGFYKQPSLY